jgi:hypothetical protein
MGFELTIHTFDRAKTPHALDGAVTVINPYVKTTHILSLEHPSRFKRKAGGS